MNNKEYDKLVKKIIKKENPIKNILIAFFIGGIMGLIGQLLLIIYMKCFYLGFNAASLLVFATFIIIGSFLTGIGFFDKILSICKCGLIVPSTGFANSMTSAAMDYKNEGFIKGIGGNIFKLTGSIILYGVVFGILFGLMRSFLI